MTCKWREVCSLREFERQGRISFRWKREYCDSEKNWENCVRYQMEELGKEHQDLLPDGSKLESAF